MTSKCDHLGALILSPAGASSTPRCNRCGEAIAGREARGSSGLMAARNENSVLFSLDSLRLLEAGERPGPVARPPAREPGPPEEGSGLIDVRALDAMMHAGRSGPTAPRAPHFDGLAAGPVAIAPRPATGSQPVVTPPPLPLYIMLGLVALGMMALAGYMATQAPPPPIVIEQHVVPAPAVAADVEAPGPEEPEAEASPEAPEPEAEPVDAEPPPSRVKSPRKPVKKPPAEPPGEKPVKVATPTVAPGPAPDSVECLLSRNCKPRSTAPAPVVEKKPDPSASLPEKLEPADISEGTRAAKAAAMERCRVHARGGEKVTIKLSIAGPDGAVISATAQDDAGNPALANCAAGELKRSSFKKVRKAQIGALATLKF